MKSIHFQLILLLTILPNLNFAQQQNIWTMFTATDGLVDYFVPSIFEFGNDAIWFGTFDSGACRFLHLLVFCLITLIPKDNEFMPNGNNVVY